MNLLLISDLHGSVPLARRAVSLANKHKAVILVNGDIVNNDLKNTRANIRRIYLALNKSRSKVYVIPGSHECVSDYQLIRDYDKLVDINRRVIRLGGYTLVGYGGSDTHFNKIISKGYYPAGSNLDELLLNKLLSSDKVILLSHIPPRSYLDKAVFGVRLRNNKKSILPYDLAVKKRDYVIKKKHVGSLMLKRVVQKNKPLLHLFGHIHEAKGYCDINHKTVSESNHLLINGGYRGLSLIKLVGERAVIQPIN